MTMTTTPDQRRIERQAAGSAIARLWDSLVPLRSVNTFMQTGAHPDDETSALFARLAKGDGVRVVYACCVRGEGGQNNIGTEFRNELGVLRTREMEAAARMLGAELVWLNEDLDGDIFDFGFSKSATETFERWGYDRTLERMVRAIRATRPDVIAPTFLDVGGQHGHHRANTVATIEAFKLAGDPSAFPEHQAAGLGPWRPKKLYLPAWSGGGGSYDDESPPPNATLEVDVGAFDPVHGATYAQMAQWSRAYHRTQGMGHWVDAEPATVPLHRLDSVLDVPVEEDRDVFTGLPNSVGDLAESVTDPNVARALRDVQRNIDSAIAAFPDNREVGRAVHQALADLRDAQARLAEAKAVEAEELLHRLAVKERQLSRASACACLLVTDLRIDVREIVGGETTAATLSVYNGGPMPLTDVMLDLEAAEGWRSKRVEEGRRALTPGSRTTVVFELAASKEASLFKPYRFLTDPGVTDDPVIGRVSYVADGVSVSVPVSPDETVALLPRLGVDASPDKVLVNLQQPVSAVDLSLTATSFANETIADFIGLDLPAGWTAEPRQQPLTLAQRGAAARANFRVVPPKTLTVGRTAVGASSADGAKLTRVRSFRYPHIRSTHMITPAEVEIAVVDVTVPKARVGYVGGGADRVDHWLRQLGVGVTPLDAAALATGDLGQYDTILVGVFAFGVRDDLMKAQRRLHAYVEAGGNLVTLYHRPWDNWDPETVPPRYLKVGQPSLRWRVTDTDAEVEVLRPDHALLNRPNEIRLEDWGSWVKERGLYFAAKWADDYAPLISMADPDEVPLQGALLSADIGRGRHVHTALILHYQLEFLVPGAFRLMANLITPRG